MSELKIGEVKEPIYGSGAPTENTVGVGGQRYIDTTTGTEYVCVGMELLDKRQRYIWRLKDYTTAQTVEMTLTFEDGSVETLRVYVA